MRQVKSRELWIGHAGDLNNPRAIRACSIGAVMELADSETFAALQRDLIRLRFPISDGGENPIWLLQLAAESLAGLMRARIGVLVCCSAGMSRSIGIAATGLALVERMSIADAMSIVAESGPMDVSPGLFIQIQEVYSRIHPRS